MEEPGGLQSMGSLRVEHDWVASLSLFTFMHGRRKWQPIPVLLPGEFQGQGSLVGCCLWGHTESDTTEWLHFHFSRSRIGEGNDNPLQYSCLENPRDGGAWSAIYGVAQSWTWLTRLSSSSSSSRTAFAASLRFWIILISFSFVSMYLFPLCFVTYCLASTFLGYFFFLVVVF